MVTTNAYTEVLSSLCLVVYYILESLVLLFIPKRLRYKDISGETVLITGAGSGIGRLLAHRFAKHGARIVIWDVNLQGAQETAKSIQDAGGEAFAYQCDISKPQNVYAAAAKVKDEVGKVTILVNNAGIVTGKRLLDCPDAMIQKTFEVNAISHFWTCKAFLPDMIDANHGHIVSIASLAGMAGVVRLSDYCASKFAAVGFEEAMRMELHVEGHRGINSTVVCPYFINTGMFAGANTGIFSMMTPEYVADEIISAVLVNQEVLILPKIFYVIVALKSVLPTHALREAYRMFSISSPMSKFSGREENGQVKKPPSEKKVTENGHANVLSNGDSTPANGHAQFLTNGGETVLENNNIAMPSKECKETLRNGCLTNGRAGYPVVANGKVKTG